MTVCADIPAVPMLTVLEIGDRWVQVSWVTDDDSNAPIRNFTLEMRQSSYAFTSAADTVISALRNFTVVGSASSSLLVYSCPDLRTSFSHETSKKVKGKGCRFV